MNDQLKTFIESSWDIHTTSDPDGWTADNPAWGQCAVTALVVQDEFGGDLLRTTNQGVSHYWNRIGATEIDHTRCQFDTWEPGNVVVRDREYVLSFPATRTRYERLRRAVDELRGM